MCMRYVNLVIAGGMLGICVAMVSCNDADKSSPKTAPEGDPSEEEGHAQEKPEKIAKPINVNQRGRNTIRTFKLHIGEALKTQRGGFIRFEGLGKEHIILKRASEWKIPVANIGREYSAGNHEYITIKSLNREAKTVKIELLTYDSPWWDTSF